MTATPATDHTKSSKRITHSSWMRLRMVSQVIGFRRVIAWRLFVQLLRYNANHVTRRTSSKPAEVRAPVAGCGAHSRCRRAGLLWAPVGFVDAESAVGDAVAQSRVAAHARGVGRRRPSHGFATSALARSGGVDSPGRQTQGA